MSKRKISTVLLTFISFSAVYFSCNTKANAASELEEPPGRTEPAQQDTLPAHMISGVYSGVFPGDITHTILLTDQQTFKHEQQKYTDLSTFKKSTGHWTTTGNKLFLTQDGNPGFNIVFEIKGDTLFGILVNGVKPSDSAAYSMVKHAAAGTGDHWQKEAKSGVIFTALGNEPFWNLKIYDKKAVLNFAAEKREIVFQDYIKKPGADTTTFTFSEDDSKILRVISQFCSDGMSDFTYEYRVEFDYNGKKFAGCGILLRENGLGQED